MVLGFLSAVVACRAGGFVVWLQELQKIDEIGQAFFVLFTTYKYITVQKGSNR